MSAPFLEKISKLFDAEESLYLLSVSIGPVQEFIAEARKTRDLWAGSYLLSMVTFQTMTPLVKKYGPDAIIFPRIKESSLYKQIFLNESPLQDELQYSTIPNHFLAVIKLDDKDTLIEGMQKAMQDYWSATANHIPSKSKEVHDFISSVVSPSTGWDDLWQSQIEDLFQIFWVAIPVTINNLRHSYVQDYNNIQQLMKGRKLTRTFRQSRGNSNFKCTQCGHREIIGPENHSQAFWETIWKKPQLSFRIKEGEKLCAVCIVKRLIREDDILRGLRKIPFESTSDISSKTFKTYFKNKESDNLVKKLLRVENELLNNLNIRECTEVDEIPGDLLYKEGLSLKTLKKEAHNTNEAELKSLSENLSAALEDVFKAYKVSTPKYFVILMLDGDKTGKKLSSLDIEGQVDFSRKIAQLGNKTMPEVIINNWSGYTVYSGGDDLLAFGPLEKCFSTVDELRKTFSAEMAGDVTCSASLVFAHHQDSLRRALEEGRQALRRAKEVYGRNAIAITLMLSSNTLIRGGSKWNLPINGTDTGFIELMATLADWLGREDDGVSPKLIYDILKELPAFYKHRDRGREFSSDMFLSEMERLFKRHLPKTSPLWEQRTIIDNISNSFRFLANPQDLKTLNSCNIQDASENVEALFRIVAFIAKEKFQGV